MLIRPPLQNEQDGSPGGGAVPAVPAPPAPPNGSAPANATPPSISAEVVHAIASQLAPAIATQVRDGVFAELRRSGQLKTDKPAPTAPAAAPIPMEAPGAPAPGYMTATDYQQARIRDRALDRTLSAHGLADGQRDMIESLYTSINPPDPSAWAADLIAELGLGKSTPTNPPQNPAAPSAPAAPPSANFSDKGPAAANVARDPKAILAHRPLETTSDDLRRLKAEYGEAKALEMHRDAVNAFLATTRPRVR